MNIYGHELVELVTCARKLQMVAQQQPISVQSNMKMPSESENLVQSKKQAVSFHRACESDARRPS